jgi:hypothetical protein
MVHCGTEYLILKKLSRKVALSFPAKERNVWRRVPQRKLKI